MPQQHLDDADVGAALQKMGGKAVAQRVHRTRLSIPAAREPTAGGVQHLHINRLRLVPAGEQPVAAAPAANRCAGCQQLRRQHDIAVLAALAVSTRITIRPLSMSPSLSPTASETRSPAA